MARLHGIYIPHTRGVDEGGGEPTIYLVSFPRVLHLVICPVPGCLAVAHSSGRLQHHFVYRQFFLQVAVAQEGAEPLSRCDLCGMYMPEGRLIKHRWIAISDKNIKMRCSAVLRKSRKARQVWGRLGKFLRREGEDLFVSEKLYRVVVQAMLIFGAETWMLTAAMSQKIEGIHVGFPRQVTRKNIQSLENGSWQKAVGGKSASSGGDTTTVRGFTEIWKKPFLKNKKIKNI